MYRNCASRSGCRRPSMIVALPYRLNPSARSRSPTVSAPTLWPWRVSSSARCGSTSPSTAAATSDRPAPAARPGPAAPGAAPDPGRPPACGPRPAGGPGPAARRRSPAHPTPRETVASRTPAAPGHQPDPAMAERAGLRAQQQPLIQVREDRRELRCQDLPCFLVATYTKSTSRIPGSYGLFFGKPITSRPCSREPLRRAGVSRPFPAGSGP